MTTQYYTATSIDGFIADSDNSLEWLFQVGDEASMTDAYPAFIAEVGALAMGSTTYEWVAAQTGFLQDSTKWEYTVPTWVFSSRDLPRNDGLDIRFVSGGVAPVFLGAGAPLLPRRISSASLELRDVKAYGTTFVMLRYTVRRTP